MTENLSTWPVKKHDPHNRHMDSTVWDDIRFRSGNIVIATCGKSGTTWTQQIVAQLLFENTYEVLVSDMSLWVDMRVQPRAEKLAALEAQTHRRLTIRRGGSDRRFHRRVNRSANISSNGSRRTASRSGHSGRMPPAGEKF
jgi:hypothetical protein